MSGMSFHEWQATTLTSSSTYMDYVRSWLSERGDADQDAGSAGVREPCRPVQPSDSAGAALALPRRDDPPPSTRYVIA